MKLQNMTKKTTPSDTDIVHLFDAAGSPKDQAATLAAIRAPARDETLTNKTLNTALTARPAFVTALTATSAAIGSVVATTVQVPGRRVTGMLRVTGDLAPGVLAANTEIVVTLAIAGLTTLDDVIVNPISVPEAGLVIATAWASAAGTLSVRIRNCSSSATAGAVLPVSVLAFQTTAAV